MNNIKYRAILKKEAQDSGEYTDIVRQFSLEDILRGKICFSFPEHWHFLRSTSLKDKNGKEVYEGDVVRCCGLGCPHEVIWQEATAFRNMGCWNLSGLKGDYDWIGQEECIGNVWENPELLTK